jgi:penicillin amidase
MSRPVLRPTLVIVAALIVGAVGGTLFAAQRSATKEGFVERESSGAVAAAGVRTRGAATRSPRRRQTDSLNALARRVLAKIDGEIRLSGVRDEITVLRDEWGVPHIYASNTDDLFFAQGFVSAQDRLWQMDMWRRGKEGRLAEVLGPRAAAQDSVARLLRYRGPMDDREWTSYHPEGRRIMAAFAAGVNAFIEQGEGSWPVEFQLTGIRPEPWTPETSLLREITFGDAGAELRLARDVARLGVTEANRRRAPDPWDDLQVPRGLDVASIDSAVFGRLGTGGQTPRPQILPRYQAWSRDAETRTPADDIGDPGSNNWVVSGRLSATGRPIVANDPHRQVTLPALRSIVHLNAPGWNVIGAGEPAIPGVAIGHNERIAWGLTIVGTDQHDVYIEELNPANHGEVRWRSEWEALRLVRDTIRVKGESPRLVTLRFSRHGPIFHVDSARHRAYALRSALLEPGTAPYLAGLRLNQTANCRDFLGEVLYWKAPSENMICGDVEGNIAWQASALTPNRSGWLGRLPVPGTGEYEWDGFRADLPQELNPARGFIATANHNIHPPGYRRPVMFKSTTPPPWRIMRLMDVLPRGAPYSIADFQKLQLDAYSIQAARDLPLFRDWTGATAEVERARALIAAWDGVLARESAAAALYMAWRGAGGAGGPVSDAITPKSARDSVVAAGLTRAIAELTRAQGSDWTQWRWGRTNARSFPHPFVRAFDLPTVERGGGGPTVAANGATFREIIDVGDWDRSVMTMVPGQSGQPGSPYYGNLLPLWADNRYFPMLFSRDAVERHAKHRLILRPVK